MTLIVPNTGEVQALTKLLAVNLILKLFSNNVVPGESDTVGTYTEVTGGGYSSKLLAPVGWTITSGAPSFASYPDQDFSFTGAVGAPGTIYGYFIVDESSNLLWAERFPETVLPFSPINGSLVRVTPKLECS